ncbi:hypothetical protein C6341_g19619 [Phytophthora cactorum]|nr:hypothetical protein C6341_g19619 [Phytophthora cactorum]
MMTGDAKATILAASTFRDLLEAIFVKFCMMTASLLQRELQAAHGPFLKLHHDGWSRGNGNVIRCARYDIECTECLQEGRNLIKRVRALNNYFSTQQRCKRSEEVQELYWLPKIGATLDCDTRVAYTVKIFQRSILDYSAFRGYFQSQEKGDGASVSTA